MAVLAEAARKAGLGHELVGVENGTRSGCVRGCGRWGACSLVGDNGRWCWVVVKDVVKPGFLASGGARKQVDTAATQEGYLRMPQTK